MSDIHDRHTPLSFIDLINDPIISRSNAPTFAASQLLQPEGRGFDANQALSERRARTVRELLIGRGLDPATIRYEYRGDTQQVQQCDGVRPRAALLECLLPNRRVEVRFDVIR